MTRFYLVPIESVGNTRGPEYFPWFFDPDPVAELAGVRWSLKDYGVINQGVVAAEVTQAQHDFLAAQAEVFDFPENLDAAMGSADRTALSNYLEAVAIPADWLSPADTYRTALRTVTGMFLFMQRYTAITGTNPLQSGLTLNTQFRNLNAVNQNAIRQTFTDLGYDDTVIRDNWTLRVLLKNAADQWGSRAIEFGFVSL